MPPKRQAASQLTQDNWDQEEETEERGIFQVASSDVLKGRVFKSAKRRLDANGSKGGNSSGSSGIFQGFGGLGTPGSGSTGLGSGAAFGSKPAGNSTFFGVKPSGTTMFGKAAPDAVNIPVSGDGSKLVQSNGVNLNQQQSLASKPGSMITAPSTNASFATKDTGSVTPGVAQPKKETEVPKIASKAVPKEMDVFMAQLKSLNQSFIDWLVHQTKLEPCSLLGPCFASYEDNLKKIQNQSGVEFVNGEFRITSSGSKSQLTSSKTNDSAMKIPTESASVSDTLTKHSSSSSPFKALAGSQTETTDKSSQAEFSFGSKSGSEVSAQTGQGSSSIFSTNKVTTAQPPSFGSSSTSPPLALFGKQETAKPIQFGGQSSGESAPLPNLFGSESTKDKGAFSFGSKSPVKGMPTFSFGAKSDGEPGKFGFGVKAPDAGKTPFSFAPQASAGGFAAKVSAPVAEGSSAEEPYEPPKPEVTNSVTEDNAVYTKRVKLYYRKDGSYVEKGVGNLFLKPVTDGDKYQLVIRADTNLGNILLNVILSKSMPTKREGKNNVTLLCIPNPPLEPVKADAGPVPVLLLIRVKTGDDADEVLKNLEDYKR